MSAKTQQALLDYEHIIFNSRLQAVKIYQTVTQIFYCEFYDTIINLAFFFISLI